MARPIDADGFLDRNAEFANREFIHPKYQVTLRELVDSEPTISPDEVRGVGEWEVLDRVADMDVFRCSACRSIIHCETVLGKSNFAYCPICGAKMEGTSDGI